MDQDPERGVERKRSTERLVFFSDAVVAIALTLLVLPLTDLVPELAAEHADPLEAVLGHWNQIFSFALSFLVIGRMWWGHHRIFEEVRAYSGPLVLTNFLWLFTIAVLPFPTELAGQFGTQRFPTMFYIGTIFLSSACQTALVLIVRRDPAVALRPGSVTDRRLANNVLSTAALGIAFVIGAIRPELGYYAILLLVIPPIIARRFDGDED
ncbi:TMEM175 family protein [Amycolatopsis rhabdoformis]|uniref:TMEM175 family protein n=1 Tax=Amycolatopsis rhabdoformis TaxID=1448059 RepID=A0ABZ1IBW1_9PSEU|nr:TMEM175 family protein [Amycolatopsis rhabdoformis]WSE31412.1 TMEM175 family protein [Amycolatopsis rhabdoformis]